jgi:hypothetical protein
MIKKLDNGNYALEISEDVLGEIQYSIYVMASEQGECSHEIVEFYKELAEKIGSDEDELETVKNADVDLLE